MTTELSHNLFDWHAMMLTAFEEKKVLMPARITDNIVEMYKILFIYLFVYFPQ